MGFLAFLLSTFSFPFSGPLRALATVTKKISRGDTEAEETNDHGADLTMTGTAGFKVISCEDAQDHGAEAAREEMGES